jgi:hypothetical protein
MSKVFNVFLKKLLNTVNVEIVVILLRKNMFCHNKS